MNLDEYEKELLKAVDNTDNFEQVDNFEDDLFEAKLAAKNFLSKTKNVNIRIAQHDMLMLKRKSAKANIPYQTILSSLVRQYAEGKININI